MNEIQRHINIKKQEEQKLLHQLADIRSYIAGLEYALHALEKVNVDAKTP